MAAEHGEDIEMEDLPGDIDYDLEYLVRSRTSGIGIHRQELDEAQFEAGFVPVKRTAVRTRLKEMVTPLEPVLGTLKPPLNRKEWVEFLLVHLPILKWVWGYRPTFLFGDIVAGITVAIMHIPQGLAYALLANLPAVYGLYASFMPVIIYSFLGTSKHISVGTFAVVQLMIGNSIERILNSNGLMECVDGRGNLTDEESIDNFTERFEGTNTTCGEIKVDIAITLAFMSGVIMIAMGLLKLGFISIFLSEPLVSGYTTGAAVHVFTSQLRHITGIDVNVPPGILRVPNTWIATFGKITEINVATLIVSIISIIVLVGFKITNSLLKKVKLPIPTYSKREHSWRVKKVKWPIPLPSQLIVVIFATIISYLARLNETYQVGIVESVPRGHGEIKLPDNSAVHVAIQKNSNNIMSVIGAFLAPAITVPVGEYVGATIVDAFVISIVTFSVTISLAQVFARSFEYTIHSNQEFIAYGFMNVVGSFFSSFNAAGSLSRSTIQANSGGRTQLVGFISSAIILIVLLALGQLFEPLPRAVLASIVWVALYGMFKQMVDIWRYFLLSIPDMLVWLVVFTATVLLGVDLGLGVGVGFSLLLIIVRTILPYSSVLGQAKDTELYRNRENFQKVEDVPGTLIFRFQAPLCFVNSSVFRKRLEMVTHLDEKKMNGNNNEGCIQKLFYKTCMKKWSKYDVEGAGEASRHGATLDENGEDGATTYQTIARSTSFQEAVADDIVSVDHLSSGDLRNRKGKKRTQEPAPIPIHTVIVDCAPIGFMDAVGVKTLQQTVLDFDKCDVQVLLAAMTKENRDILDRAGFFEKCGKEWVFPSIQDAVHHAQHGSLLHPTGREEELTQGQQAVETSLDQGDRQQEDVPHPDVTNEEEQVDIHMPELSNSEQ